MPHVFEILDEISLQSPHATANEDAAGALAHAAWVIDGATGISDDPPFTPGPTDPAWLAQHLDRAFAQALLASSVPKIVLPSIEQDLAREFRRLGASEETDASSLPSAAMMVACLDGEALHLSGIGDCTALAMHWDGRVERYNFSTIADAECLVIQERDRLRRTYPGEDPWPRLKKFMRAMRRHINLSEGYFVVHPTRPWADRVNHTVMMASSVRGLFLMTDGLYRLVDVFGRYDDDGLFQAAERNGLHALADEVRALEREDASCTRFPRVKTADDATGLLLSVDSADARI